MTKTTKIIIGIIVAIIVIGGIWYGVSREPKEKEVIKIGVSAVLTGEIAIWGQNVLAGITLATEEVNKKGGINGQKIELIVEDDKALPAEGANVISKLINIDKVVAILGGSGSGGTSSAVPIAQQNKVPFIVAVASAPHLTKTGDYIFRVTPSDAFQGRYSAEFIYNKMDAKKAALVYVKNDWGQGIANIFKKEFPKLGGEIVYESSVLQEDTDLKTEITKIKNSGAEVLYFPVYPKTALAAFKQMKEMGFDLPVVCGDAIDGEEVIENEYAEGVIYNISKPNLPTDFEEKIKSLSGFGNLKVTIAAPLGYDATKILFLAIEKVGTDKMKIREELAKTSYKGVSNPLIEFDEDGDLKSAVFEARIIKDKKAIPYEE